MQALSFKNVLKAFVVVFALLAGTAAAHADSISFYGTDKVNTAPQTIDFYSALVGVGGTGALSDFTTGSTVSFIPTISYGNTSSVGQQLFKVTAPNSSTLKYVIDSISYSLDSRGNVTVMGDGTYTLSNGLIATGTFDLTTQGSNIVTTFSDLNLTSAATPEPNSLMLLGTGFVSAAGMLIRRRKAMAV